MKTFACVCSATIFFENVECVACGREVGWCPSCARMVGLERDGQHRLRCGMADCGAALVKCRNYVDEQVCNRCVEEKPGNIPAFCDVCRFNDTIPDLSVPGNRTKWSRLEAAKRRLFYTLDMIGLPYGSAADGFEVPLSFDFKADRLPSQEGWHTMGRGEQVFTGHARGKITINIKEADDLEREKLRADLGEPHRTVIGHFRHEIGHYYWELLVKGRCENAFIEWFGDHDNPPYDVALTRHYTHGPPEDWPRNYVSAYASAHPWEDFAETFALYLDIVSVLDTARNMGLAGAVDASDELDRMVADFTRIGLVMNEMNREMGLLDYMPEIVHSGIVGKLGFVHRLVQEARPEWAGSPANRVLENEQSGAIGFDGPEEPADLSADRSQGQ